MQNESSGAGQEPAAQHPTPGAAGDATAPPQPATTGPEPVSPNIAFGEDFADDEVVELAEFASTLKAQAPPPEDHPASKLFAAIEARADAITS